MPTSTQSGTHWPSQMPDYSYKSLDENDSRSVDQLPYLPSGGANNESHLPGINQCPTSPASSLDLDGRDIENRNEYERVFEDFIDVPAIYGSVSSSSSASDSPTPPLAQESIVGAINDYNDVVEERSREARNECPAAPVPSAEEVHTQQFQLSHPQDHNATGFTAGTHQPQGHTQLGPDLHHGESGQHHTFISDPAVTASRPVSGILLGASDEREHQQDDTQGRSPLSAKGPATADPLPSHVNVPLFHDENVEQPQAAECTLTFKFYTPSPAPSEVQNAPQATILTQTINPLPSGPAGSSTSSQKTLQKRKREDQGTSLRQTKKLKESSQVNQVHWQVKKRWFLAKYSSRSS
ncbi:hypothetical protein CPB84DRAFT_1746857 [Gymnopilus junonius]|uniref:Uncharacterized protein n=1 Tax=Gymnopilus junonius TaxID=109634 RepID=A0A9P5TNM6_GYMJU|nr:hypothetical protein CPB84DRAFT_1746857 [Gymnopilus junonius]